MKKIFWISSSSITQRGLTSASTELTIGPPLNTVKVLRRCFYTPVANASRYDDPRTTRTCRRHGTSTAKTTRKSLALSVHFYQPDLGMKGYEVLSRASAFLLAVDAKDPEEDLKPGPYGHLAYTQNQREKETQRHTYSPDDNDSEVNEKGYSTLGGPKGRTLMEVNWLEFVPKEVRPQAHVVCSSHVVSPFLWREHYTQDWMKNVTQKHIAYTLHVIEETPSEENESNIIKDPSTKSIAKFALHAQPFHHPEGRDLALLHLKDEASSLKLLKRLGVEMLHLRDSNKLYEKGETLYFDGHVAREQNVADLDIFVPSSNGRTITELSGTDTNNEEDVDMFYPYTETGYLSFHTKDLFFATTPTTLPEGLCGAPVLDEEGFCCGVAEGIVPVSHSNKDLAGSAVFFPSFILKTFVDYIERALLEKMMPKPLFDQILTAKKTNNLGGGYFKPNAKSDSPQESNLDEAYDAAMASLRENHKPEEVNKILDIVDQQREAIMDLIKDGNVTLNEAVLRVCAASMLDGQKVSDQLKKQNQQQNEEQWPLK